MALDKSTVRQSLLQDTQVDPASADTNALVNKAVAAFLLGKYDRAERCLQSLMRTQSNPRWLLNYGYLLYQQRKYKKAVIVCQKLIETHPYYIEAYLNAFKACLMIKDYPEALRYCTAAMKLAPERPDVLQAQALYYFEIGDTSNYLKAFEKVPESYVFLRPSDNDLDRVRKNASVLVGEHRVDVFVVIFAGDGLRTVLLAYRDDKNAFPKPRTDFQWHPFTTIGKQKFRQETVDVSAEVAMTGCRMNGLEKARKKVPHGFLRATFHFDDLDSLRDDNYVGLMLVDYDKKLRLEPSQIFVRDLKAIATGDLVTMYQDLTRPPAQYIEPTGLSPKVFLSYASEDKVVVDLIFRALKERGIDAWKDDKALRIGEKFDDKIERAIEEADFALVFLSSRSVAKTGFVQREFKKIIETAKYKPFGIPFAMPVKLDACKVPREFSQYQWRTYSEDRKEFIDSLVNDIMHHFRDLEE